MTWSRLLSQLQQHSHFLRLLIRSTINRTKHNQSLRNLIKLSPLFFINQAIIKCEEKIYKEQIRQITKQQLVQLLNGNSSGQFMVVISDRFKKLQENQFREEFQKIIEECRTAKVENIYMIDSQQIDYLHQIVRLLKNLPKQQNQEFPKQTKSKSFQCYFKSKSFVQAFQLQNMKERKLSDQIKQIRHYQIQKNNPRLLEELTSHMSNHFAVNRSVVVKQCFNQGECVQSYKKQVKKLFDEGMLAGKSDEFKFYLVVDQPVGMLGNSSEYFKNFQKCIQKLSGKTIDINKKQDMFLLRKDIFGSQLNCWSQWLRIGQNYNPATRFMMFIRPRINYVTKVNTLPDLMWFLRTASINGQPSVSLNNGPNWQSTNNHSTVDVLKLIHSHNPKFNYLVLNTDKVNQLIRHMQADYKYAIFKQDSNVIWKKQFLDLDQLEKINNPEQREKIYNQHFSTKIEQFSQQPSYVNLVAADKQLQINIQKLTILRDKQLKALQNALISTKKYIIRVCNNKCGRYIKDQTVDAVKQKIGEEISVYWIDNQAQNIGVKSGDYLLVKGNLIGLQQFLSAAGSN